MLDSYSAPRGFRCKDHSFRHTHASMLLAEGINLKALQLRLGHDKLEMTMDILTHTSQINSRKKLFSF